MGQSPRSTEHGLAPEPDSVLKPEVGCPASRRGGLGLRVCADRGSAPYELSEGVGASVVENSGYIWKGLEGEGGSLMLGAVA